MPSADADVEAAGDAVGAALSVITAETDADAVVDALPLADRVTSALAVFIAVIDTEGVSVVLGDDDALG